MANLPITGQMKIETLQARFKKEFGLTLRIYEGREFADSSLTLAQVRKKKGSGKALSVAKNMKVGNLEDKINEEFGLKVQVAGSDDTYLCDNNFTLKSALEEDVKKLARKAKKASRKSEGDSSRTNTEDNSSNAKDNDGSSGDENRAVQSDGVQTFFINHDKARNASAITWESDDYQITDLEPYLYAIQCDDGEDFHELVSANWPDADGRDDFKTLELNNFQAVEGNDENEYLLCFTAVVSTNLSEHPEFEEALRTSENKVVAKIQFKKNGKPVLDADGDEAFLFFDASDEFVNLEKIDSTNTEKDGNGGNKADANDEFDWAEMSDYKVLRFGYGDDESSGDFIENINSSANIWVATAMKGDDDYLCVFTAGAFALTAFGDADDLMDHTPAAALELLGEDLAKGFVKSIYEQDFDGLLDVDEDLEEQFFMTDETDEIAFYSPCLFALGSSTEHCDAKIDLKSGKIQDGEDRLVLEDLSFFFGRRDEDGTWVMGIQQEQ